MELSMGYPDPTPPGSLVHVLSFVSTTPAAILSFTDVSR